MRIQRYRSRWLRRSLGFLLGLALVSGVVLPPPSAIAGVPIATEPDYYQALVKSWKFASKIGGYFSQAVSAWNLGEKVLEFVGLMSPPLTLDDINAEIDRVALYADRQLKREALKDSDDPLFRAYDAIYGIAPAIQNGTFDRSTTNALSQLILNGIEADSSSAVNLSLDPQGLCAGLAIFNLLPSNSSQPDSYDWRMGMGEALKAVATRLVAMEVYAPTFRSPTSQWHDSFMTQLTATWQCLQAHLNLIHPPKPFHYCHPWRDCTQGGCGCADFVCSESRSWVQWPVTESHPAFPLCDDYTSGTVANGLVPSYASRVAYEDAEADAESTIDHDNLPVVFALQRMIDSLKIITSGQPDLAATNQLIRLGSNPSLCLAAIWNTNPTTYWSLGLDSCSSANPLHNWSYDRATGRISTISQGVPNCITGYGPFPEGSPGIQFCTDDEMQIWDWNPDTGIINNSWGSVLSVKDGTPQAGSSVVSMGENSWYRHRQTWTNGVSSSCTGAICAAPGAAAWNQGTIGKTTQRYPIDFSIFSYLEARNIVDVRGPVAVHGGGPYDYVNSFYSPSYPPSMIGGLYAASFSINGDSKMPVPLVAGVGDLTLYNGTLLGTSNKVWGTTYYGPYGTAQVDPGVTPSMKNAGYWVKTDSDTNPIDFQMAIEKLQGMSTAITKYAKNGTVTKTCSNSTYCNLTLSYTGNANPVVFAVNGDDLAYAFSIQFNVPAGRTVLINVGGTSVKIKDAGFSVKFGNLRETKTLWNLYQALYFETESITVPGSVLAPFATTVLKYGAINGTLVAWSLDTSSEEFHWYPFHDNAVVVGP